MSPNAKPHYENSQGASKIEIGAKQFICIGAKSPFDHPHIAIDMGTNDEAICPYCSTLYAFNPHLQAVHQ